MDGYKYTIDATQEWSDDLQKEVIERTERQGYKLVKIIDYRPSHINGIHCLSNKKELMFLRAEE